MGMANELLPFRATFDLINFTNGSDATVDEIWNTINNAGSAREINGILSCAKTYRYRCVELVR